MYLLFHGKTSPPAIFALIGDAKVFFDKDFHETVGG